MHFALLVIKRRSEPGVTPVTFAVLIACQCPLAGLFLCPKVSSRTRPMANAQTQNRQSSRQSRRRRNHDRSAEIVVRALVDQGVTDIFG